MVPRVESWPWKRCSRSMGVSIGEPPVACRTEVSRARIRQSSVSAVDDLLELPVVLHSPSPQPKRGLRRLPHVIALVKRCRVLLE